MAQYPSKAMALDIGEARIGVAISDDAGRIALPREVVQARPFSKAVEALVALVEHHQVAHVVLGEPLELDGSAGAASRRTERWHRALSARVEAELHRWDERLTSAQAERDLRGQGLSRRRSEGLIDQAAATLILQSWLDARQSCASS